MANVIKFPLARVSFLFLQPLKKTISLLICACFCFIGLTAQQVINVESRKYDQRDSSLHGDLEFSLSVIKNQNQLLVFGNKFFLQKNVDVNTYLFLNEFNFVQANQTNLDYNSYQHFRYKRNINPWLNGEAFVQTQFNQQMGIEFRGLLAGGPRIRLLYADSMKLFIAPMWMYEYEETTLEDEKNVKNRLNLYTSFSYFKEKNFSFDLVVYYQPDFINLKDFRLLSEIRADMQLTSKMNYRVSFSQNYNTNPPPFVPANSINLRNSLIYRF